MLNLLEQIAQIAVAVLLPAAVTERLFFFRCWTFFCRPLPPAVAGEQNLIRIYL